MEGARHPSRPLCRHQGSCFKKVLTPCSHSPSYSGKPKPPLLSTIPGIIHIYDVAESDGLYYIAMEYIAGKTLEELIGGRGLRLDEREALKYGTQIADAMATRARRGASFTVISNPRT